MQVLRKRRDASSNGVPPRVESLRRSARAERFWGRLPRALFVTAVVIFSLLGLREAIWPEPTPPTPPAPDINVDQAAEDFAQRFTRAYLTYDADQPGSRERALRGLVPSDLEFDAGFSPSAGAQEVSWTQVAQNQDTHSRGRVLVVAAGIEGSNTPLFLAIPIDRSDDGELQLSGYPALVGPPAVNTNGSVPTGEDVDDEELIKMAKRVLENYLSGSAQNLAADLDQSAEISMPTVELKVTSLVEVAWADGPKSEAVRATVTAQIGRAGEMTLSYELGLRERGGRPYVTYIETSPTQT